MVERKVVIIKRFKRKAKHLDSLKVLNDTHMCDCTPRVLGTDEKNSTIIMEDCGSTYADKGTKLGPHALPLVLG